MRLLTFLVLRQLSDGKFHSKESLAQTLHVLPSCISKALHNVERFDVLLHTKDQVYLWKNPIKWIDEIEILRFSPEASLCFHFIVLSIVDSTNRFLLDLVTTRKLSRHKNPVVIAEFQTQGRGRFQRPWHSGLGDSLTFSLFWRFDRSLNDLSGLSLVIGVAIIRTLNKIGIDGLTLKWPNDVLFRFRKLAGILIEHCNFQKLGSAVVIGIGINVQLSSYAKNNIDQAFVDLYAISGEAINRNRLLAALLSELVIVLKDFNHFSFEYFKKEWISYHAYEGKLISFALPDGSIIQGIVDGVDSDGSLRLKLATGVKCSFNSGELLLR